MSFKADLGKRVRQCRRAQDLTQRALAKRCGCGYQSINGLERGHHSIYAERLATLASVLGVSADYLLGLPPPSHPHPREEDHHG